jgi:hypothetical protein
MVQHQQERLNLQFGTYVGDVANGKPDGTGSMTFKNDDAAERKNFQGQWVNGKREGQGTMRWGSGEQGRGIKQCIVSSYMSFWCP